MIPMLQLECAGTTAIASALKLAWKLHSPALRVSALQDQLSDVFAVHWLTGKRSHATLHTGSVAAMWLCDQLQN